MTARDLGALMRRHAALLDRIIAFEGRKLTNVPGDPGGLTKFGITWRTWDAADGILGNDDVDAFKEMTEPEARAFYAANFLAPFAWLADPDDVAEAIFAAVVDYAIHSGPRTAACTVQGALGVKVDGIIGSQTRGAYAALSASERGTLWRTVLATRLIDMGRQITKQKIARDPKDKAKFCEGWLTRMATQLVQPNPGREA